MVQGGHSSQVSLLPSAPWVACACSMACPSRCLIFLLLKVVGIMLTLVCLIISATGVYGIVFYAEELALHGGPYAVTGLLVLIQNVIPVVVKMLVKFEGLPHTCFLPLYRVPVCLSIVYNLSRPACPSHACVHV